MILLDALLAGIDALRTWRGAMLVQMQSMGFWRGKQFRAYREFSLAGAGTLTLRFVCAKDFLLTSQSLYVDDGAARLVVSTGGTPAGSWVAVPTVNAMFRIGIDPVTSNILTSGGSVTGGTEREVLRSDSGGGAGIGFDNRISGVRGLPAGTYYFTITATGTTTGMYSFEYEELD